MGSICNKVSAHLGHALLLAEDITAEYDLSQVRRDFVANASHELRTPVTVFTGYLETLLDLAPEPLTPYRPALEQMHQQAQRMRQIIDDLLTLSAIERCQRPQAEISVDMHVLMTQLSEEAQLLSQGRHQLTFEIRSTEGVLRDESVLHSVFSNLISNAIRYTPEGGKIWVRWYVKEAQGIFEVQDTGIGIPREHLPRLTERFYRVDTARSRAQGGTGLGLAIVKHGLELHGGTLEVESTPQIGSCFKAVFPAQRLVKE
jgi:two-component system phosphate regulon sensor histidine kinase PhoR